MLNAKSIKSGFWLQLTEKENPIITADKKGRDYLVMAAELQGEEVNIIWQDTQQNPFWASENKRRKMFPSLKEKVPGLTLEKFGEITRGFANADADGNFSPSLLGEEGKFKFVPREAAAAITADHRFATHKQSHVIWAYGSGSYIPSGEELIRAETRELLGDHAKEGRVNEVVAHIRETTFTDPERFIPPVNLVNLKNGVLDIKTNKLTDHSPDIIFTNELPAEWNPQAKCPKIMKFLSEVLDPGDIYVVQEIVGYCLLRDYRFAKAVMLLGSGANGKSTLLNLIAALLGERNVATPALQDLIYHRFAKAELYGKLANIHADIPTTKLKYTGIFKMLTGRDIIWAEKKHTHPFEFRNYAKLLYSANELPQTDDMSEAFWRRWIIIKFPNVFSHGDPRTDPSIIRKLTSPDELSGFLTWALEGLKRLLRKKKFTMTKARDEVETEWVTRSDSLRAFVMKHVLADPDCHVTKDDFYAAYQEFCSTHDIAPTEKAMVGRRLPTLFPKATEFRPRIDKDKQLRAWKGIRLSEPYDHAASTENQKELTSFHNQTQCDDKKESRERIDKDGRKGIEHRGYVGSTVSDLEERLFDTFGIKPFKPSQLPEHFSDDEIVRLTPIMETMMQFGRLKKVSMESGHAWEIVRSG